jgi:hypothetical protein
MIHYNIKTAYLNIMVKHKVYSYLKYNNIEEEVIKKRIYCRI